MGQEDLEKFLSSIERLNRLMLETEGMKAELELSLHNVKRARLDHIELIRVLSQKYHAPIYDSNYEVDVLTGEIKPREKPNA